jgi:HD-GYP domain-containing protein (c-di-GMP phosphodiesterase class II)
MPSLTARLESIHSMLMDKVSSIDRIAFALYDKKTDLLKTFINSTKTRVPIKAYEIKLADVPSLSELAVSGNIRVINDVQSSLKPNSQHSSWVLDQEYQSSFTLPINNGSQLLGFVFFDSFEKSAFTDAVQRDLLLFSNLIQMAVASEIMAIDSLLSTAAAARDFARLRDFETGKHLDRMARFSRLIAKNLQESHQLSDEYIEQLYLFAPLHDIGKIGIPDAILLKPGRLTTEERSIMQTHVEKGVQLVDKVLSEYSLNAISDADVLRNLIGCHHEFLDGSGYPKGLSGSDIPLEARIITVADIFDALTSQRPYKKPWSVEIAIDELRRMAGEGKLDVACIDALEQSIDQVSELVESLADDL